MVDLYDEVGYIKNVIVNGIGYKWERDITLYVRYMKTQLNKNGKKMTRQEVTKLAKEKIEKATKRKDNPINYNDLHDFARRDKVIEKAWKNDAPLRHIQSLEIPREVLDWFLHLDETFKLTSEELEAEKEKRPKVHISKKNPMTFARVQYLFTLYIWSMLQKEYLGENSRYYVHYIDQYKKKFKHDANLKSSFSLNNERNYLYDLGFINVNFALGVEAKFMLENEIFKIPVTDENRVIIEGSQNDVDGDLINCGLWLEKQKYGSFVCQNCGKEIIYKKAKKGRPKKYCDDCFEKLYVTKSGNTIEDYNKVSTFCIDCGKEILKINPHDFKTIRCIECQRKMNNFKKAEYHRRTRLAEKAQNEIKN